MVESQRQHHGCAPSYLAAIDCRLLHDSANPENSGLTEVKDWSEAVDSVGAEVRYRESSTGDILQLEMRTARFFPKSPRFESYFRQRFARGVTYHRNDEPIFQRDCDSDVGLVRYDYLVSFEPRIHPRMFYQRARHRVDQHISVGDFEVALEMRPQFCRRRDIGL